MSTRPLALAALLLPWLAQPAWGVIAPPQISVADVSVTEGDDGMTMFTTTISLLYGGGGPTDVQISAKGVTADETDYVVPMVGRLTLTPEMPLVVTGYVVGDRRFEGDETFLLFASPVMAGQSYYGQKPGMITIVDDDTDKAPRVRADEFKVAEGSTGWHAIEVPLHLDRALSYPVTLLFQTMGGLPWSETTPWGDYRTASQYVAFAIGQTTAVAAVQVNGDTDWEEDGHFSVALSAKRDVVVDTPVVPVTLLNDDAPAVVTIADVRVNEGQAARHPVSVRLSFTPAAPALASVHVDVVGGTARAGEDFVGQSLDLHPSPGATSMTFATTILGDTTPECDEGIIVEYQGVGTGDPTKKVATILLIDDDGPGDGGAAADGGACPDPFATRSTPIEPAPDPDPPPPPEAPVDAAPRQADASPDAATPPHPSGCGCAAAGSAGARGPGLVALALLGLAAARRRRHRDIPVRASRESAEK